MDLSIVIVNHNTHALLEECLKSVFEQTRQVSFEVFVVDNSTEQEPVRAAVGGFPEVQLILQGTNRGFAAANNEAIRAASGRWILLLNTDTWLLDGAIDKVVEFGDSRARAGAIGCTVLNPDGSLQRSCFTFPGLLNLFLVCTYLHAIFPRSKCCGRGEMSWWDYGDEREVDFVKGCFLMASRAAIDEVGLLDEDYFVYGEEADWCRRMRDRGWSTLYTPGAKIVHIGEASTQRVARAMILQYWGSLLLFIRKHHGRLYHFCSALLVFLFFAVRLLPWGLKALIGKGDSRPNARNRFLAYGQGMVRLAFGGAGSLCTELDPLVPAESAAPLPELDMCGITGILNLDGAPVDPDVLDRMVATLHHRGPDESGTHLDRGVGLGHARLSIIDLAGGQQPMANEDGTVWITFNGEIYNFVELRQELEQRGHRFSTRSDTEVIVHLYEEEGEKCVHRLNGQWAFAIWDRRKRRLFLSRDRMGIRPLFYTLRGNRFLFGSELKALLEHPDVPRELDLEALDQLFTFWCTMGEKTLFQGLYELPPAHSMVVERGSVEIQRYWSLDYGTTDQAKTEGEWAEELRELLIDATRLRLRSDVPVGAYLSGGLDSTVTTALIKGFTDTPLQTFSVAFDDPEFDESGYQREASEFLDTQHQEIRCSEATIGKLFPSVIRHTEKPVLRTAPAPLALLSSLVRKNEVKVVVTGEGADEVLGGYDLFKEAKIRRFWGKDPDSRLRPQLLRRLYPYLKNLQSQSPEYLKAFFQVTEEDLSSPFFAHLPRWALTARIKVFYSAEIKAALGGYDALGDLKDRISDTYLGWDGFSQAQYLEATQLLPGYILSSQGDRMSMANSVEGRFPFLDHRVVEFASRIPPRLRMKGLREKHVLKLAAAGLVPPSILQRPKQPYRAPEANSFFTDGRPRLDYVADLLCEERLKETGLFNPAAVRRLLEKVKSGRAIGIKDNMALVGILSTQLVVEQFINRRPVSV